jgi:hypothetical protein
MEEKTRLITAKEAKNPHKFTKLSLILKFIIGLTFLDRICSVPFPYSAKIISSCSTTYPLPLPMNPLPFSYGIIDGTSTPGLLASFFVRSKPLDNNPNTCTPRNIIIRQSFPAPIKNYLRLIVGPPN